MKNRKSTPEEIIQKLESARHAVSIGMVDGIHIEATINDDKLVFLHRLDAFARPAKQQALAILAILNAHYEELAASSETFRSFVGSRHFATELYVFSGQMDFSVATMDQHGVKWHVNLDDA